MDPRLDLVGRGGPCDEGGATRLRRTPRGRDGPRRHDGRDVGRRAHGSHRRAHERGPGLRPQPDSVGLRRLGPLQAQRREVRAGSGDADPPEHRGPLRRAVRDGPRGPAGRLRRRRQGVPSPRSPRARLPATRARTTGCTRMQPYFNPGPDTATVAPPIYLGGVQHRACALAGAVADGFVSHPTNSNPRYLVERCLPALAEGAKSTGPRPRARRFRAGDRDQRRDGRTPEAVLAERERQRRLLAFLYSTPAYAPTLDALRMGRPRPAPPRPRAPRPLGRPRPRPLGRGARRTGARAGPSTSCPTSCSGASPSSARASPSGCPADPADDDAFRAVVAAVREG